VTRLMRLGAALLIQSGSLVKKGARGNRGRVSGHPRIRRGDVVEVRSAREILATLDGQGRLQGLAYMPEMRRFCGGTFRVFRRADLVCVEGLDGRRWMKDAVLLEDVWCDGSAHGDCQRGCLVFWKEQWLRKLTAGERRTARSDDGTHLAPAPPPGADQEGVQLSPSQSAAGRSGAPYSCQSAHLHEATEECAGWEPPQYLVDAANGNVSLREFLAFAAGFVGRRLKRLVGVRLEEPWSPGKASAPGGALDLQPGEIVQVRSREEILASLDPRRRNRGLTFEQPMLEMCGRRFRVQRRVDRIIIETTGEMRPIRNTVVLEGVNCSFCPRANPFYWREIWLERVEDTREVTRHSCDHSLAPGGTPHNSVTAADRRTV
jgi:hypothetical protein